MRKPLGVLSLVPAYDATVHVVLNGFGKLGSAYLETAPEEADEISIINNLLAGEYSNPLRVIAFNLDEGWARDVSKRVALAVVDIALQRGLPLPDATRRFIEKYVSTELANAQP